MDERVSTSGAWLASTAGMGALAVIGLHLPYLAAWALNTAVILGVSWGICRYKRSRAAWACFWTLAVVCAVMPFLALAGLMGGGSAAYLVVVVAVSAAWYWLLRVRVVRPDAPPEVQHVVHHHVVHDGTGVPAAVPVAVAGAAPHATIPGHVERPAISAASDRHFAGITIPEAVLQRIGRR